MRDWLQCRVVYGQITIDAGTKLQHIRSLSGAFCGKPWPVSDHGPHTDMLQLCPTISCSRLRKKWNFWTCWKSCYGKIKTVEAWLLVPEHHGHVYGPGMDIPRIIPDYVTFPACKPWKWELSFASMPHIHLIVLLSTHWSANLFSFFTCHVTYNYAHSFRIISPS